MKKWISISAQRHIDFENSIKALKRHRLNLNNLSPAKSVFTENQSSNMIEQLQKLNDLFKSGVLTKDEYDANGDGIVDDTDGDGIPYYLDNDQE